MTKPSNFIMHSGYASIKNNDNGTVTLNIPNGAAIGPDATAVFSQDIVVGKSGGSFRSRGRVNGGTWMPCSAIDLEINVEIPAYGTGVFTQPYTAYLRWINATTIRLAFPIFNYSDQTLYVRSAYTFEFKINTFLPPF